MQDSDSDSNKGSDKSDTDSDDDTLKDMSMYKSKLSISTFEKEQSEKEKAIADMDPETRAYYDMFKRRRFIISSTGWFKTLWNYIIIFAALYNSFQTPLIIAFPEIETYFKRTQALLILDYAVDIIV